ncbi:hypothetical protein WH47_08633 [Habropoda laboriosa]|uniref:Uncharacterized protein n=1 Tax=Habropoda laboriosa TaxID=597456 RepID=A0A0L7RHE9_9HYME|nr:hypothetical protein WH47_08633 [Habropoda laboriosa]
MSLYGSPVWAGDLVASRHSFTKPQRRMAIRVVRGYRTISREAALTLAGLVPFEYLVEGNAQVYGRVRELRRGGAVLPRSEVGC